MLSGEMTAGRTDDGGYEVAVFLPVADTRNDAREDSREGDAWPSAS
jgi:hypothetical protein